MLHFLTTYAVPINLAILMLVAGTEIRRSDLKEIRLLKPAIVGSVGQLLFLPLIGAAIVTFADLHHVVAAGVVILALCPGGGISNAYCYFAKCSVLLSALMTAVGSVFCLVTIPAFIVANPGLLGFDGRLAPVPAATIVQHLIAYMIVPLAIGALARDLAPHVVERSRSMLRILSLGLIAFILLTSLATVASQVPHLLFDIVVAAGLFILLAMAFGTVLGIKMSEEERHVTTIESGVRNIALALTLGTLTMDKDDFLALAAFLTGYLAVEIAIMLPYAAFVARRRTPQGAIARP